MNENINLVEILRDVPKGTKLWSPIFGECEFIKILPINICQIQVKHTECNTYHFYNFTPEGKFSNDFEAECLLFPSKQNRDWSTFKAPLKHKHFEPFQRILVADNFDIWRTDLYDHYDEESHTHCSIRWNSINDNEILPYKGNEDKLGKKINKQ